MNMSLTSGQRGLLVRSCSDHVVGECQSCGHPLTLSALFAGFQSYRRCYLCPACSADVTLALSTHVATCPFIAAGLRVRTDGRPATTTRLPVAYDLGAAHDGEPTSAAHDRLLAQLRAARPRRDRTGPLVAFALSAVTAMVLVTATIFSMPWLVPHANSGHRGETESLAQAGAKPLTREGAESLERTAAPASAPGRKSSPSTAAPRPTPPSTSTPSPASPPPAAVSAPSAIVERSPNGASSVSVAAPSPRRASEEYDADEPSALAGARVVRSDDTPVSFRTFPPAGEPVSPSPKRPVGARAEPECSLKSRLGGDLRKAFVLCPDERAGLERLERALGEVTDVVTDRGVEIGVEIGASLRRAASLTASEMGPRLNRVKDLLDDLPGPRVRPRRSGASGRDDESP